ncbi:hypothetical protein CAPSP0001_0609 [Capnocytophaga sputigena ATCC 33612]|nr:hypothetical protein CAPSP0001_0609 [Capnocytophaga sputigena ATCC 33612]
MLQTSFLQTKHFKHLTLSYLLPLISYLKKQLFCDICNKIKNI